MFSWEIDNFLRERHFKTTLYEVREIMIDSPQVIRLQEIEFVESEQYGKYRWSTNDGFDWIIFVKNNKFKD